MSGSSDRPRGPQGYPPQYPAATRAYAAPDPYEDPVTGPPLDHVAPRPLHPVRDDPRLGVPEPEPELYAPARERRRERRKASSAPIVPAGSVTGKSLTLVVSIMCFLACLTAGAVYMMNQSANAWLNDIASEVTVQVEPREGVEIDKVVRDVVTFLGRQPGIRTVQALSLEQSAGLLEPWLGQSEVLKTLPVPRLVALTVERGAPPDMESLRGAIGKQFKGVSLDDHRQWQQQIRTVTRSFALGGLAILLLVAAATTAIIVSATRSSMASNRDIVEVLHFVGATDRFIAREFEKHFLALGVRAGLVGALSAMIVFLLMPTVMELLGGGTVTIAEIRRLVGTGSLDPLGYGMLGLVVVVIAALCMLTSRFGVFRILNSQH
jgi:cell division transport system permease protein